MKPFSATILPVLVILGLVAGCSNPSNSGSQVGPGDSSSSVIAGDDDSEPSASNDFGTITGPNGVAIPGGPYDDPRGKTTCITGIDPSYANKTIRFFVTNGIVSLDEWSAFFAIGEGNITEEGSAEVALFDINFNNWKYRGVVTVLALIYDDTGYVAARWAETHAGGGYNTSGSEFLNFEGRRIELDWEDFDQDV